MKPIKSVSSEGTAGPAYLRFSNEPVAQTEVWDDGNDVVVDFDAAGSVVGVELVSVDPDVIEALVEIARRYELDLSALVARSFDASPVA